MRPWWPFGQCEVIYRRCPPPHCCFNAMGGGSYDKTGGGPPSPWCCEDEQWVAQPHQHCCRHPPCPKTESAQVETQGSSNVGLDEIEWLRAGTSWRGHPSEEVKRGFPGGIPLNHAASCEWQRINVVGPGRTPTPRRVARQARERGPPALILSVGDEVIGWPWVRCRPTSWWDKLTTDPSISSKPRHLTFCQSATGCGADTCPRQIAAVFHRPPKKNYSPCLFRCDGTWVIDLPYPRSESNGWDPFPLRDEVIVVDVARGAGRGRCTTVGRRDPFVVIWVVAKEMIEGLSAHLWRTWWPDKPLTACLLALSKPPNQNACRNAKRSWADTCPPANRAVTFRHQKYFF